MNEGESRPAPRVHPVDLLVLVVALSLGALAYAYLFKRSPVSRPVDAFLGIVVEVEFDADRDWKREFPKVGDEVTIEQYLVAETLSAGPAPGGPEGRRRVRLKVHDRESQKPETMTLFRTGVFRGALVRVGSLERRSEVQGEVISVEAPGEKR